jgi:hypothetical protein
MTRYRDGDLLTVRQIAERFGKSTQYVQALAGQSNTHQDPNLFRLRVGTDETYRRFFETRAKYVYAWPEVRDWYRERQTRGWVIGAAKRGQ